MGLWTWNAHLAALFSHLSLLRPFPAPRVCGDPGPLSHPQDLPEQPYLQPPLSVLVIERRAFGHTVLVGSHVVPHMLRFTLRGQEDAPEEQEEEETGDLVPKDPRGKGLSA